MTRQRTRLRYDFENWDRSEEHQIDDPRYRSLAMRPAKPNLFDCSGIKRVVFCTSRFGQHHPRGIYDMIRETPTQLVVGRNGKETHRLIKGEHGLSVKGGFFDHVQTTPAEVKRAERILAKEAAEAKAKMEAQVRIEADPHYQLVKRLRNADFEPYDKLTLEQLQQIAAWLDEVRDK